MIIMTKETYLEDSCLYKEKFQEWLVKGKKNSQARRCQKTIELLNISIQALRSHAAGKKYLEITHKVSCFFLEVKDS